VTPYYDRDGITIWHARCEDILPSIAPATVDLLLTDPPYGIGYTSSPFWDGVRIEGDDVPFDPAHLLRFPRLVLWGANRFCHSLPESNGWILWDKRLQDSTGSGLKVPDAEMAWTNVTNRIRVYRQLWAGPMRGGGENQFLHPTQKPVAMMCWILEQWTKPGDLILDPYMGSGPVARAAHLLGRRYIGIECVEEYCRAAVNRLAQPTMFQEAV
jgi:site-specific DNA-methyltransferase (adenine-specific)